MAAKLVIDSFEGADRFLSNFYPCSVEFDGLVYPSVEHAYQAAKTLDPGVRIDIQCAATAGQAKRLGQTVKLRPNWETMKIGVMKKLLYRKFGVEPFKSQLLATYPYRLIEGNTWGDQFWGVCNGRGENHLGRLLMYIRGKYRDRERGTNIIL